MYTVYVLENMQGLLYKGMTANLERRIVQHNKNYSCGTRGKGPWTLVYCEEVKTRLEARSREKFLKSGVGREYLKSIVSRL